MLLAWRSWLRNGLRPARPMRRAARRGLAGRLSVEALEDRTLPSASLFDAALPLLPTDSQSAAVGPAGTLFQVTLPTSGRLTAELHAEDFAARLSLRRADGTLLVQSEGGS